MLLVSRLRINNLYCIHVILGRMDGCVVREMHGWFGIIADLPQQFNWLGLWAALWEEGHCSWP